MLQDLYAAKTKSTRTAAATALGNYVVKAGLRSLALYGILDDLTRAARSTKDPLEREGAMVGFEELFRKLQPQGGADPYLIGLLPDILDRYHESGKTASIATAAERAAKQLVKLSPPELAPKMIEHFFTYLDGNAKWKCKVGALELLSTFAVSAKDQVAERLGEYVPRLTGSMRDTKAEVRWRDRCGWPPRLD